MSTPRTTKPLVRFALPDDAPDLVRAASLALAVARHCKATTWAEFVQRVDDRDPKTFDLLAVLDIDRSDSELVARYDHVLRLLSVKPLVTTAVCPECDSWVLVSTGAAPSRCRTTARCEGKPIRAAVATRQKDDAQS